MERVDEQKDISTKHSPTHSLPSEFFTFTHILCLRKMLLIKVVYTGIFYGYICCITYNIECIVQYSVSVFQSTSNFL